MGLPATNPISPLLLPAPHNSARFNDDMDALTLWSQSVSPRAFFMGTPLYGKNPPQPPSSAYLLGVDNPTVTFNTGVALVTFPAAFPNGIMYIQVTDISGTPDYWSVPAANVDLAAFYIVSAAGATGAEQISYSALGW